MEQYLNKVIQGDCLEVMKGIPDKSITTGSDDKTEEVINLFKSCHAKYNPNIKSVERDN